MITPANHPCSAQYIQKFSRPSSKQQLQDPFQLSDLPPANIAFEAGKLIDSGWPIVLCWPDSGGLIYDTESNSQLPFRSRRANYFKGIRHARRRQRSNLGLSALVSPIDPDNPTRPYPTPDATTAQKKRDPRSGSLIRNRTSTTRTTRRLKISSVVGLKKDPG